MKLFITIIATILLFSCRNRSNNDSSLAEETAVIKTSLGTFDDQDSVAEFHLGDGQGPGASRDELDACLNKTRYRLKTKIHKYSGVGSLAVPFEVTEDGTKISRIHVDFICGLDDDKNSIAVVQTPSNDYIRRIFLNKDSEYINQNLFESTNKDRLVLNKGVYQLYIEADRGVTDHDDFIIGGLSIQTDKAIKKLKIETVQDK